MAKLQHIVTDLHQIYLTEMEAKIKPQLGKTSASSSGTDGGEKKEAGGGGDDNIKKQARQLVYDTRYKARREGLPLERAFAQALQNSKASAPVKDAAKAMLFSGGVKEETNIEEEDKQKVLVTPAKGYGKPYRRYASRTKIHQLRSNPQIQSVTGTSYGTPYEGERTKGKQTTAALQHKPKDKKSGSKPDFLDLDGDGNKKESMKKAASDKKKVEEAAKPNDGNLANNYPPYDKVTRGDVIAGALGQDQMGGKKKKKKVNEEYSDWRSDLQEVISNSKNDDVKKIAEKNVNNKVIINPELSEEVIAESVEVATEFFFEQGLNEDGLNILIEELGLEDFTQFVFDLANEYTLTEARRSGRIEPVTKGGKSVAALKGGAKTAAIKRLRAQKAASRSGEKSSSNSSGMTAALKRQSAVANAKKQQPAKKPLKDRIAKGVLGAVKAYQQGMERHRAATATAGKAVKVAAKGASEFGKGVASGVKATAKAAQAAHKVLKNSYESEGNVIDEETPIERLDRLNQERLAQRRLANQQQQTARSQSASAFQAHKKEVLSKGGKPVDALDSWQQKKIQAQKNAKTEAVDPSSPLSRLQQNTERLQTQNARRKLGMDQREEVVQEVAPPGAKYERMVKHIKKNYPKDKQGIAFATAWKQYNKAHNEEIEVEEGLEQARKNVGASKCWPGKVAKGTKMKNGREVPNCVPEENELDELNRLEKETGKDIKGKPVVKGGTLGGSDTHSKVMRHMHSVMGAGRMGAGGPIQPRGKKKDRGGPTPGPVQTPAQKVAKRRADAQRAQDMMHSPRD